MIDNLCLINKIRALIKIWNPFKNMAQYDNLGCDKLYELLTKNSKQIDEQSFSELITNILELKQDDIVQFYILTTCMKAEKAGHITKDKLQNLFDYLKVKTVKDLKKKLPTLNQELLKGNNFRQMYKQVYSLFLINSTTLDVDYAIALWSALLKGRFNFIDELNQYIQQLGQKRPKKVHKDLWNMMFQFGSHVKNINKDYSQNDAWPVFIDNFVEWMKNKKQNN